MPMIGAMKHKRPFAAWGFGADFDIAVQQSA